ncbi:MAG TPA: type IV pilus secretin PilQ [Syntrophales bacterium]|nr:type IV pilus secretin PilQ [Syntrophales bacterium]
MTYFRCEKKVRWLTIVLFVGTFTVAGCADYTMTKKDPFFDKWEKMVETSKGNSPAPRSRENIRELIKSEQQRLKEERQSLGGKSLPETPISLRIRQADVKVVLRSLARIVGQNVLVRDDIKGDVSIDFKNTPWNQAFTSILKNQGLAYEWEGNIIRVVTIADKEQELKRKTQEKDEKLVEPLITVFVPIDYANTKDLRDNLNDLLIKDKEGKARGSIRVDEHTHGLILNAIRNDLEKMLPIIDQIDKPTSQILIKANIVETTKNTARNLGIQWGGWGNTGNFYVTPGGTRTLPGQPYTPVFGAPGISNNGFAVNFPVSTAAMTAAGGAGSLGFMYLTANNALELQLNALQQDGKLNILSTPSITTMDNQMAYTENGQRVPYVTQQISGGVVTNTVSFENVVLRLEITPHVIDGQTLKMKVVVKKDEIDTSLTVLGNPGISKKETSTNLIVRDGDTIVISGLTKGTGQEGESGIPGLKDVPGLGWLFKSWSKSETMEEVLIFITPTILPIQTAAAGVKHEPEMKQLEPVQKFAPLQQ